MKSDSLAVAAVVFLAAWMTLGVGTLVNLAKLSTVIEPAPTQKLQRPKVNPVVYVVEAQRPAPALATTAR